MPSTSWNLFRMTHLKVPCRYSWKKRWPPLMKSRTRYNLDLVCNMNRLSSQKRRSYTKRMYLGLTYTNVRRHLQIMMTSIGPRGSESAKVQTKTQMTGNCEHLSHGLHIHESQDPTTDSSVAHKGVKDLSMEQESSYCRLLMGRCTLQSYTKSIPGRNTEAGQ